MAMRRSRLAVLARTSAVLAISALAVVASKAQAFDCAKASNRFEKAICSNAAARAADERMSKAFSDLAASADAKTRSGITASQIAWLSQRNGACADSKANDLSGCLARESDRRQAFLTGAPEQGPGAPDRIVPWFQFEKGGKERAAIDMELLTFADPKSPGELAFNGAVKKLLDDILQPEKGDFGSDHYAFTTRMRLVYASPKLVSAQADGYADSGGAHPNSSISNINLDVGAGRLAQFNDVFDAKSADKVFAICVDQVRAAKKRRGGADELSDLIKNVREATSDLAAWSFESAQAVVTYDPYAVGTYAEGYYECKIGYDKLRPFVKPNFPLP